MDLGFLSWNSGDTGFRWPWALALLGLLLVGLLVRWSLTRARRSDVLPEGAALVAHAARLRQLPRYRQLLRRRVRLAAASSLALIIASVGAIVLVARVQDRQVSDEDQATRDIVLCLDASGSMAQVDAQVLREFSKIVDGLRGERVGLTIWSGTAITVFPLTDDYDFAQTQLREARRAFASGDVYSDAYGAFTAGTITDYDVQSQIGDGLASCVQRFDRPDEKRSRAIVLASDNEPIGSGVYTLGAAADYASERGVIVHAIAAPMTAERPPAVEEFRAAASRTGGTFSLLGEDGSAAQVVEAIGALAAQSVDTPPIVRVYDQPRLGVVIVSIGIVGLLLVWLVEAGLVLLGRRGRVSA